MSIDRVRNEIRSGDALASWAKAAPAQLFASTAELSITDAFREVMEWVQKSDQFRDAAKEKFASGADGWLVAYARVHGNVVVTQEVFDPEIKKRIPIPNVCRQFGVGYRDTFSMLRELRVRFAWKRA